MFEINKEYKRRRDIHDIYGGQHQGGISTPKNQPVIFIFMSGSGHQHGYYDFTDENGVFNYTGEGQIGDMVMQGGNKAIRDHQRSGKTIHVFEQTRKAYVRYVGTAECLGYKEESRPDTNGQPRNAFIFLLDINSIKNTQEKDLSKELASNKDIESNLKKKSLSELRKSALLSPSKSSDSNVKLVNVRYRSQAIKAYALARSSGICESCNNPAPFSTKSGPFLECHHIYRVADGGPDAPENVIALCPNCHRRAHYSKDKDDFFTLLVEAVKKMETNVKSE